MSTPITAICAVYIAYKAHSLEPFATIGKMCVAYKIFKFLNNIFNDGAPQHITIPASAGIRAMNWLKAHAHTCTTDANGTITYSYQFGGPKTLAQIETREKARVERWNATKRICTTAFAASLIPLSVLSILYLAPTPIGESDPQNNPFNPANNATYF